MEEDVLHPVYLPFTDSQLLANHFAPTGAEGGVNPNHLAHFTKSLGRLAKFESGRKPSPKNLRKKTTEAFQLEKDERFWVVAALLGVFYAEPEVERGPRFARLLHTAFNGPPPFDGFERWEDCLAGPLRLYFEVSLPAPKEYKKWLRERMDERMPIPHLRSLVGPNPEGRTVVDAVLLSEETGFAALFEAKVLSDVSTQITYDAMRNQIARNVDVMLESHETSGIAKVLQKRRPDRSCFVLLTPELFRKNPEARLYGWLMKAYREGDLLERHLGHRQGEEQLLQARNRLGWLTFEDCRDVAPETCKWLEPL
jgi:hypothetical protein